MRRPFLLFVACLALPSLALAQKMEPRGPVAPASPSRTAQAPNPGRSTPLSGQVYLGEAAPEFELEATTGERRKLSASRGDFTVLLFADRRTRLADLDALATSLERSHTRVVAVIHENVQALQSFTRREALTYTAFADPTGEIAAIYGLWDDLANATRPGVVMLDREGHVRFMLGGQNLPASDIEKLVQFALQGL